MSDETSPMISIDRRRVALSLAALPCLALRSRAEAERERLRLDAKGRSVDAEVVRGAGAGPRPAIFVMGGSKGYGSGAYRLFAAEAAGAGLDTVLIDYLAGQEGAILAAGSARARSALYAGRMADWTDDIRIAMEAVLRRPEPPSRFGVLGVSLGAMPALLACSGRAGVGALAIVDGSLPGAALARLGPLPPLLAVWGGADAVFPVDTGVSLRHFAEGLGSPAKLLTFEGQGHAFFVDAENRAAAAARTAVVDFFAATLR